ncbi:hypothetical protein ATR01nite_11930 [Acetobacter tropicalis]|jgi:hypothetical protein|uniref:Uncharacterized protein n=1 Tax=Acetobacter tropicalis TaxID=104102 RepID=A0A511FMU4_9PROT|nr:hypothetical protein ATR01nite_11930 [Acetobacter tropicalis]
MPDSMPLRNKYKAGIPPAAHENVSSLYQNAGLVQGEGWKRKTINKNLKKEAFFTP